MTTRFRTVTCAAVSLVMLSACADQAESPPTDAGAPSSSVGPGTNSARPADSRPADRSASSTASSDPAPTSTSSPDEPKRTAGAPRPPLPRTEPGPIDRQRGKDLVRTVVSEPVEPLTSEKRVDEVFGPVATGQFLAELKARRSELRTNGWTEKGTPEIVSLKVTSRRGRTASIAVCLDQSRVRTFDAEGRALPASNVPRALHLYDLEQTSDRSWRITAHRFPDDPVC